MAQYGAHAQGRNKLSTAASASATLIAAPATNSEARLHLQKGWIVVEAGQATNTVGLMVMQTTAEGSQAATLFTVQTATGGAHYFDFGDKGFECSSSAPRIAMQVGGDASVVAMFTGYHTGFGTT
jgi:hypothetical protein